MEGKTFLEWNQKVDNLRTGKEAGVTDKHETDQ
jgi:hypothetical protein